MAAKRKSGKTTKCRTNGCGNQTFSRGVCQPCYRELNDLVVAKTFTDEALVAKGAWAPRGLPGRKRSSKVSKALGLE